MLVTHDHAAHRRLQSVRLEKALRVTALLACATVAAMLGIFLSTGVGQDPLQYVHSSEEYGRILLTSPTALRATIGLDNFFIVFYATVFVIQAVLLARWGANRALTSVALGLLIALALLDMGENFHFMVMLARAEHGLLPSPGEIGAQVFESLLKFHVSYLGLFLMGLALPRRSARERWLSNLCLFVQLPVGVLIYVTPPTMALALVFVRFAFFLTALLLVASIFGKPSEVEPATHAIGSGAPE